MNPSLTSDDIDAIARRVVSLLAERLSTTAAVAPIPPPAPPSKDPELKRLCYTVPQLAELMGVSHASIYRFEARRELRSIAGFRKKLYSKVEVERFLAGGRGRK